MSENLRGLVSGVKAVLQVALMRGSLAISIVLFMAIAPAAAATLDLGPAAFERLEENRPTRVARKKRRHRRAKKTKEKSNNTAKTKEKSKNTAKTKEEPAEIPIESAVEPGLEPIRMLPTDLPPPPALPRRGQAVALLPLQGLDVGDDLLRSIEMALLSEVDETDGMIAVSSTDVYNDLAVYDFDPMLCEGNVTCLAKAGRYARCHFAIETRVAALGGTLSISMRLIDTQTGLEVGRVADPISEDAKERAQELHRMSVQLLAPETYVGSLSIKSAQDGAEVYLDDRLVGTTPLDKPLTGLAAGPHILRVSKPGFSDLNQFVDVVYKRHSSITVDLQNATISGLIVEVVSTTGFGSLFVVANEEEIEVRVDGEPKGMTPLDPIEKVAAGERRISFRKEGRDPLVETINIVANQRTELAVRMNEAGLQLAAARTVESAAALPSFDDLVGYTRDPLEVRAAAPWSPSWKFWTGVGLGAAAAFSLGFGSYAAAEVSSIQNRAEKRHAVYEQAREDFLAGRIKFEEMIAIQEPLCSSTSSVDLYCREGRIAQLDKKGKKWMTLEFVALGVGSALALTGGALVIWDILADPAPDATREASVVSLDFVPRAGGAQLVVSGLW